MGVIKAFFGKYLAAIEIALLVLVLAFGVLQTVRLSSARATISELNTRAAQLQAARERQRAEDERHARAVEGQLRDSAAATQKEAHEREIADRARVADLVGQLRNRPQRPAAGGASAAASGPAAGATGAGLYREDGEFLAGEAAAAAGIARERDTCRRQYHNAQEALKKYQAERAKTNEQ